MENKYFVIEHYTNCYYGEIGDVYFTIKFFGDYNECQEYINNSDDKEYLYITQMNKTLEINY